jgi:enoyl-CoA hydratase/carnithine racemase
MWRGLHEIADYAAAADPGELRALVFTGTGRGFSVGGDFDEFTALGSTEERRRYVDRIFAVYRAIEELPIATIAAVHGHVLGGGCELTMICDLVVADETAMFGLPETAFGLYPGIGVARGREQLSQHWLRQLVLLGEPIPADEARIAGLVNQVVPSGGHLEAALEMAHKIAARAPLAVRSAKRYLTRGAGAAYDGPRRDVARLMGSRDHAEGIAAFREGRAPGFEGR